MRESRNVSYISNVKNFEQRIAKASQNSPIDEKPYSKQLFMSGREDALLEAGLITEDQKKYAETGYTGDIKNSVNYLRGYERGLSLAKTNLLPPEYLETKKAKHR